MKAKKLVHGVGVNDADYVINSCETIGDERVVKWRCPFYVRWQSMLKRCYSEKFHASRPTYKGCSVDERWHTFMEFRGWMMEQDHEGKQLDKDLLVEGSKVYGPETCIFVDRDVNMFITDCAASRGDLPIGVSLGESESKPYKSQASQLGKRKNLGNFHTPEEAHQAWRMDKYEQAIQLASEQSDPRVAAALIERYKL